MNRPDAIYWLRQDLRLADNPALQQAALQGTVLPVFILDNANVECDGLGAASRVWLHHSLQSINNSLEQALSFYQGDPLNILLEVCQRVGVHKVYWNRCYEPWRIKRDSLIKAELTNQNIEVQTYNGSLLWEPWEVKKSNGTPYKVFTPFYRKGCLQAQLPRRPLAAPVNLKTFKDIQGSLSLNALELLPSIQWHKSVQAHWQVGEEGAQQQLLAFLQNGIKHYREGRDFPAKPYVSRLSPYLHFGEISPNQAWYATRQVGDDKHVDHFCSELGWREFAYSQLYYNPQILKQNLQPKFDRFPWSEESAQLTAWQTGKTGIPIVDAGMRELWQTGYMHNRVRMLAGSFLVKNLLVHWRYGVSWFWDCLFDADLANNSAAWQWVAGCGADAAPYFRIFNPVTQGQKFDPSGRYTKRYLPELSSLPVQYLFNPWEAPEAVLRAANVQLGVNYPKPLVDLKISRQAALDALSTLKN